MLTNTIGSMKKDRNKLVNLAFILRQRPSVVRISCLLLLGMMLVACQGQGTEPEAELSSEETGAVTQSFPQSPEQEAKTSLSTAPTISPIPPSTATPTKSPSPTHTIPTTSPTPTVSPTPTITPTPVPEHLIFLDLSLQLGERRCLNLLQTEKIIWDRLVRFENFAEVREGSLIATYYDVQVRSYANWPPEVEFEDIAQPISTYLISNRDGSLSVSPEVEQCIHVNEATPPGFYAVPYVFRLVEADGPYGGAVQGGISTEATLYLNLLIHPAATISEGERLIAFTSMRYGLDDVFVMNASGWGLTRLPNVRGRDIAWSPSGEQIAFGHDGLIAVINVDGSSNPLRLTSPQDNSRNPAWSPDGSRIAFGGNVEGSGLYLVNADGSGITKLAENPAYNPAWSPDGSQIAFISSAGPIIELRVIGADGSDERYLADIIQTNPHRIAWSPDGSQIAFVTDSDGDRTAELNLIKPDGSGLTRLTAKNPAIWGDGFTWAPDGSRLAISSNDGLYIVNADGSGMTKLTEDGSVFSPSWSPDGDKIIFIGSFRDRLGLVTLNGQEIYSINPDGSGLTNLTNDDTMTDMNPVWQP